MNYVEFAQKTDVSIRFDLAAVNLVITSSIVFQGTELVKRAEKLPMESKKPLDYTCPFCGAEPGVPCVDANGEPRKDLHLERIFLFWQDTQNS